uniref:Uncharacterized protein n=1 Tax=Haptolina brevifila TaxID=156173 RepID=A0A7S2CKD3_9EUKA|mmetsp:Transcript_2596/g.5445  ORF Transcript_2596/g.5445 Transcript_2596/m.5445 type:complete len:166 (+) Transcript_2596:171-668(+)
MVAAITALVQRLSSKAIVRFDPPVPRCAMVHCYLHAPAETLEACHTRAREASGVRLWNALRGPGHEKVVIKRGGRLEPVLNNEERSWQYFEWSVGFGNMHVKISDVERGWTAFLEELLPVLSESCQASSESIEKLDRCTSSIAGGSKAPEMLAPARAPQHKRGRE